MLLWVLRWVGRYTESFQLLFNINLAKQNIELHSSTLFFSLHRLLSEENAHPLDSQVKLSLLQLHGCILSLQISLPYRLFITAIGCYFILAFVVDISGIPTFRKKGTYFFLMGSVVGGILELLNTEFPSFFITNIIHNNLKTWALS